MRYRTCNGGIRVLDMLDWLIAYRGASCDDAYGDLY